jgi:hypothetical protein
VCPRLFPHHSDQKSKPNIGNPCQGPGPFHHYKQCTLRNIL